MRFTPMALDKIREHQTKEGFTFLYESVQSLVGGALESGLTPEDVGVVLSGTVNRDCKITSVRFDMDFYSYVKMLADDMGQPLARLLTAALEYEGQET